MAKKLPTSVVLIADRGLSQESVILNEKTWRLLQIQDWGVLIEELLRFAMWWARNYEWRYGGNWELAVGKTVEDLVQGAILKTLEGTRRYDPEKGELKPWLIDVVKSEIDHLCHSKSHRYEVAFPKGKDGEKLTDEIGYDVSENSSLSPTRSPDPGERMLKEEDFKRKANALIRAVDGDPELEKIYDAVTSGCKIKSQCLADELGIPIKKVYNQMRRLRRRALKLLKEESREQAKTD